MFKKKYLSLGGFYDKKYVYKKIFFSYGDNGIAIIYFWFG